MIKRPSIVLAAGCCVLVGAPTVSFAQSNEEGARLDEIVVTAQRRASNLQDISVAATALNADQLAGKAVERLSDLQFAAPGLSITDQGLTQSVNIRGIGLASGSPQVTNGVASYQDGVFQPPIVSASSFYDIANIEILRGPQGTFVGSNSTGGAIFINTANPELGETGGSINAGIANYGGTALDGALNIPVSDTFALRVAGLYKQRDSFYKDLGPLDSKAGELDESGIRLGALWEPGAFSALAKVELIDKKSAGYAYRPTLGTDYDAGRTANIRELSYNSPTLNDEEALLSSLKMDYEFSGGTILRSVSGYSNKEINNLYDSDATTLTFQTQSQYVRERQWSQEVNIISPETNRLSWIIGGYYQLNEVDVDIDLSDNGFPTDVNSYTEKTTTGVFAHFAYDLSDALEVEFGVRYSEFESEGEGSVFIGNGLPMFPPGGVQVSDLGGEHNDDGVTGKIGLNWSIDDNNLLYAFVARGYKAGGFNSRSSEFDPETVVDYEFGWKSTLFDGHVNTQLGIFYNDYEDFQFGQLDPATGQSGDSNVGGAIIKGFEAQVQARFGTLGFDAGVSFVDSSLDSVLMVNERLLPSIPGGLGPQCPAGTPAMPPVCFNYAPFTQTAGGKDNLFSPDWTYNFGVEYDFDMANGMSITPRLNYAYVDSRYTNLIYDPALDYLDGRGLVNALVTLRKDSWSVEIYGNNLMDKEYISGQSADNEFYGAPREYGLRASLRY